MTANAIRYLRALENEIDVYRRLQIGKATLQEIEEASRVTSAAKDALVQETHGPIETIPGNTAPMQYMTLTNGNQSETMLAVTLYGPNRNMDVVNWHRRVMVEHFGLNINYVQAPFPHVSHGHCMNQVMKQTVDSPNPPDYYLFIDNDAIFLRRGVIELIYTMVCNKLTVFGHAWQSNHKYGPNNTIPHPYASQATLCFPRSMYLALGRPDMDHWVPRSDTAEELTYAAKKAGYIVSLVYPSHSVVADTPLDNGMVYGMGNTYGPLSQPLMHHTSCVPNARHTEVFIETCKKVIAGEFDRTPPAAPYGLVS